MTNATIKTSRPAVGMTDHSEGMAYLETLPRKVVTVYMPLGIILVVLLFPFYWMVITSIKPDRLHLAVLMNHLDREDATDNWGIQTICDPQ